MPIDDHLIPIDEFKIVLNGTASIEGCDSDIAGMFDEEQIHGQILRASDLGLSDMFIVFAKYGPENYVPVKIQRYKNSETAFRAFHLPAIHSLTKYPLSDLKNIVQNGFRAPIKPGIRHREDEGYDNAFLRSFDPTTKSYVSLYRKPESFHRVLGDTYLLEMMMLGLYSDDQVPEPIQCGNEVYHCVQSAKPSDINVVVRFKHGLSSHEISKRRNFYHEHLKGANIRFSE